ncbi:hypothetical protein ACKLNR_014707 [Fusarium oxysporum f. sp. zingiberi]
MWSQTVYRLNQRNSFDDLTASEETVPQPGPYEVLVRIRSVALNYRDVGVATSSYPFPVKDNVVPCSDLAGEIASIGASVEGFSVGDKVIAAFDGSTLYGPIKDWNHGLGGPKDGALRQYISLPSSALVSVGETKLSYSQLSSLVCTGTTAWNSLFGNVPIKPGQTVLFLGTGGVSITGLILAKAAGAVTIITSSSDKKLEHVQKTYGADHIINYKKTPKWDEEVRKITNGNGVDYVLETGGAGTIAQSINSVTHGGIISVIGFLAQCEQKDMPDVALLALSKAAVVRGIIIGSRQHLEEVTRFVVARDLEVPVEKEFGFSRDQVIEAYKYLQSGQHIGKVCINVD